VSLSIDQQSMSDKNPARCCKTTERIRGQRSGAAKSVVNRDGHQNGNGAFLIVAVRGNE
jgi:hypothetical protein